MALSFGEDRMPKPPDQPLQTVQGHTGVLTTVHATHRVTLTGHDPL
jgi:hypothetical protein